jgi:diguanylate cyclase (GGDEF)-like protein
LWGLPEQDAEPAHAAPGRLRREVEDLGIPHASGTPLGVVTISCGVATSAGMRDEDSLLKAADTALYVAKKAGRNRVSRAG